MFNPSAPPLDKSTYNPNPIFIANAYPVEPAQPSPQERMDRYGEIVEKYLISNFFALKLRQLEKYNIAIICDDSGSMSCSVINPSSPFEPTKSRWSEAQRSLRIIVDIASLFDPDGIDIYYLNRAPIKNITRSEVLDTDRNFLRGPSGSTPLGRVLKQVLEDKAQVIQEKPLLLIIFTDGVPDNLNEFVRALNTRSPIDRILINIVACTDDITAIGYLDGLDKKIKFLDVCDDFYSEKRQIQKIQGSTFNFTFGDYISKILLGPIDPSIDQLDEKKKSNKTKSNCLVS
jgi:hypothetical protein